MACAHITEIMDEHAHFIREGDNGLPPYIFPQHAKPFEKFLCRVKDPEDLSSKTGDVDSG